MSIPNVEVLTLLMFLAGFTIGLRRGMIAATVAGLIYFGFNPQGMFPPLLAAQIVGVACAPTLGWFYNKITHQGEWRGIVPRLLAAGLGVATTILYDLLTNLAYPLATGMNYSATFAVLMAGIPLAALHIASNAAIFFFVLPLLIRLVKDQGLVGK